MLRWTCIQMISLRVQLLDVFIHTVFIHSSYAHEVFLHTQSSFSVSTCVRLVYASPAVPLPNTMTLDRWRRIVSDCCGQDMCTVDDYPDVLNVFVRYIENEQYFWAQSADQVEWLTRAR